MMLDPAGTSARLLPFWFSREIATYAVDFTDFGYLQRGLVHGVLFALLLVAVAATASGIRLRRRPHLRILHP